MKDAIAALIRGRRRRPARCAHAVLAAAAMLAAATGVARAQPDPRWHDPTRAWSIDFVSSDWGHAEGLPADGPALLTMPMRRTSESEVRMCIVEQAFAPPEPGTSEADIRARAREIDAAEAAGAFPRMELTQVTVSHADIGGQSVALVEGMSRGNVFRGRVFITPARAHLTLSTIACILTPGMRPEAAAEVDTILNTLRFEAAGGAK